MTEVEMIARIEELHLKMEDIDLDIHFADDVTGKCLMRRRQQIVSERNDLIKKVWELTYGKADDV